MHANARCAAVDKPRQLQSQEKSPRPLLLQRVAVAKPPRMLKTAIIEHDQRTPLTLLVEKGLTVGLATMAKLLQLAIVSGRLGGDWRVQTGGCDSFAGPQRHPIVIRVPWRRVLQPPTPPSSAPRLSLTEHPSNTELTQQSPQHTTPAAQQLRQVRIRRRPVHSIEFQLCFQRAWPRRGCKHQERPKHGEVLQGQVTRGAAAAGQVE